MSCRQHAHRACPRCDAPLCPAHEPPRDERCEDCEAAFNALRDEIESTPWRPSLQREAFVLFASVILKLGMMAIVVALLLWVLDVIPNTTQVLGATAVWTVALLAVRRLAEGPSKRAMTRRARRSFLKQHVRAARGAH